MTNRDLEIFSTVAECQSMSRAAQLLYISPSSVSQAIAKIEADYSIHLFDRVGKKLMITDSGRVLLEYAHKIYEELGCPIINVSDRSIEESASIVMEVMNLPQRI